MVHIIVDKHMNKINKYRTIAKGYRIAAQRFWLLPIPEFKISRIKKQFNSFDKEFHKKKKLQNYERVEKGVKEGSQGGGGAGTTK